MKISFYERSLSEHSVKEEKQTSGTSAVHILSQTKHFGFSSLQDDDIFHFSSRISGVGFLKAVLNQHFYTRNVCFLVFSACEVV